MNKWKRFFKIAKIDEDKQMVYGYASTNDLDSDGEIIKVEALRRALPSYLEFPTIREMHEPKPIGTTKEAKVDKKGLYIGAKIVNKEAWELVKEGVYKAFSIGGDIIKRVGNIIQELDLIEISLVDVPANKHATIEIWKRGKISKDAETAYSMANLVIQVKDRISYYEFLGKDTKKLKRILEELKEVLVIEASEKENYDDNPISGGIFDSKDIGDLEKKINIMKSIDLGSNKIANLIREGVISNMNKTVKKLNKVDDPKDEESTEETTETKEEEATETKEKDEKETSESEETKEESTEESKEEAEETKETGELNAALEKVSSAEKALEKLSPSKTDLDSKVLSKAVSSIAGSLAKAVETIVSLEGRIATLEKTPAALKSKSALVLKSIKGVADDETGTTEKSSGELAAKEARIAELTKIYDQIGKVEYAKKGHSQEAARLMVEIEQLKLKRA